LTPVNMLKKEETKQ